MPGRFTCPSRPRSPRAQVSTYNYVDTSKIIVIGYSFGGTGALNLALAGTDGMGGTNTTLPSGVVGVASFHGELATNYRLGALSASSRPQLLLESGGQDDTHAEIAALLNELEGVGATYEISRYGASVYNCFTVFGSANPSSGCVYDYAADKASWLEMVDFFTNVFANTTSGSSEPGSCVADIAANATDAEKLAYILAKYGQSDFTLTGITGMTDAERATLAASIVENEIVNMTNQYMAYVLATGTYTMALPNSTSRFCPDLVDGRDDGR